MGGSNAVGAWGYVEGFREILEQYKSASSEEAGSGISSAPSDIVVASGSGGRC